MGAQQFSQVGHGKTAEAAFAAARETAQYEDGHQGYTGTIAEKAGFTEFAVPLVGVSLSEFLDAAWAVQGGDPVPENLRPHGRLVRRVAKTLGDKWGPAACFEVRVGEYLFEGVASS